MKGIENKDTIIQSKLLGVKDVADFLGVKINTIYAWVSQRKINFIKVGRLVKFDLQDINNWIEENKVKAYEDKNIDIHQKIRYIKNDGNL